MVIFGLMVLEEIPRRQVVSLCLLPVREAGQQGGICPYYICPFGGGANITKPSFDDVLFTLSFSPGWRQSLFAIFYSVDFLLSVSAHKLSLFLCIFHFISLGLLASEQRRDIVLFPSAAVPILAGGCYLSQVLLLVHLCGKAVSSFWASQP